MPRLFRILFLIPFLFLPAIAHADPVPALTITGGTIMGGRGTLPCGLIVGQGICVMLTGVDPTTGNTFNFVAASEGGFVGTPFFSSPGQTVTFLGGIAGSTDFGAAALHVTFSGSGGPIPIGDQPTLDLPGFGTATIEGTFYATKSDAINGQNPIFTIPFQTLSGPVLLHFISGGPTDPRYDLHDATLTVQAVPEPASVILLLTSVAGLGVFRRRKKQ
jgi:hypothetical protein